MMGLMAMRFDLDFAIAELNIDKENEYFKNL